MGARHCREGGGAGARGEGGAGERHRQEGGGEGRGRRGGTPGAAGAADARVGDVHCEGAAVPEGRRSGRTRRGRQVDVAGAGKGGSRASPRVPADTQRCLAGVGRRGLVALGVGRAGWGRAVVGLADSSVKFRRYRVSRQLLGVNFRRYRADSEKFDV